MQKIIFQKNNATNCEKSPDLTNQGIFFMENENKNDEFQKDLNNRNKNGIII